MRVRLCRRAPAYASIVLVAAVLAPGAATATTVFSDRPGGRFLVTLAPDVDAHAVAREYRATDSDVDYVYTAAVNGFAGRMSETALAGLLRDRRVVRLERDGIATTTATQSAAVWGLDRIDQRKLPLDSAYTYGTAGAQVHAYVLDTGIRKTHSEFSGRVGNSYDAITSGGSADDCHGHGTHVAGTVGGTKYGVAKSVTLHAVRVLDCTGSGTWSGVIAGIDWVIRNHVKPATANLSLGGGANATVDDAVKRLIAAGVTTEVAAGNNGANACNYSPARVAEALTVAATDSKDTRASWSNYGSCIDVFAPGVSILSAGHDTDTDLASMNGTSMASPHVAGAAARHLEANPGWTPAQVHAAVVNSATTGLVATAGTGSPNRLLYIDAADGVEPPNAAPTASFTATCSDLTCAFKDTSRDSDGVIGAWSWRLGDGGTSASGSPSHTYAAAGTYTVTLTVTDDDGATATTSQSVSVTEPKAEPEPEPEPQPGEPDAPIQLTASGYKLKGVHHAQLQWTGATAVTVDVFRNGTRVAIVSNTGSYVDSTGAKGSGSYTYSVCDTGTQRCSNAANVTF